MIRTDLDNRINPYGRIDTAFDRPTKPIITDSIDFGRFGDDALGLKKERPNWGKEISIGDGKINIELPDGLPKPVERIIYDKYFYYNIKTGVMLAQPY